MSLGRALHVHGAPAPEVEQAMERAANRHGLKGQFFATPTSIFASFPDDPAVPLAGARTLLLRVEPGSADLGRRAEIESIARRCDRGELSAGEARTLLAAVDRAPAPYSASATVLAVGWSAAAAACFLGCDLHGLLLAMLLGWIVGLCGVWAKHSRRFARLFLPGTAFLATAIAGWIESLWGREPSVSAVVAGLITLLPGLTLTTALSEVALGHLASGTARLVGSMMTLLALLFGAAIGGRVGTLWTAAQTDAAAPLSIALPQASIYVALLVAPLCFGILFRAPQRDMVWITLTCALGFVGTLLGRSLVGNELSEACGGFVVGLASNIYARATQRPPAITLLPGLLLLVPGSIGFQSLFNMLDRDVVSGVEAAFRVALVGTALVAGLLVANVVLPARKQDT